MKNRKIMQLFICIILSATLLTSCAPEALIPEPQTQAQSFYEYYDTVSVVISYKGDPASEFKAHCDAVSELLKEYHQQKVPFRLKFRLYMPHKRVCSR